MERALIRVPNESVRGALIAAGHCYSFYKASFATSSFIVYILHLYLFFLGVFRIQPLIFCTMFGKYGTFLSRQVNINQSINLYFGTEKATGL